MQSPGMGELWLAINDWFSWEASSDTKDTELFQAGNCQPPQEYLQSFAPRLRT